MESMPFLVDNKGRATGENPSGSLFIQSAKKFLL